MESRPTHYRPEVSDIVPMEEEGVEFLEDGDNDSVMEVDEDQNQAPSNKASRRSNRVSRPPRDLSSQLHGVSHKLSECPLHNPNIPWSHKEGHMKEWKNTSWGCLTTKHRQPYLHEECK